jgi:hypothetical protein
MADDRILRNTVAVVSAGFVDPYGEPREAVGDVSIAVRTSGNTTIDLGLRTASEVESPLSDIPEYGVTLTSEETELERLYVEVTDDIGKATSIVDIVGGFFFSVGRARAADNTLRTNPGKYDDASIIQMRSVVEAECEDICGQAFVPRFGRLRLRGSGEDRLLMGFQNVRSVRSITIDGTALTDSELDDVAVTPLGLQWSRRCFTYMANVDVAFEVGMDRPPADLVPHTISRLRNRLNADTTAILSRATAETTPNGTFTLFTPGLRGAHTGLPEVDEAYARYTLGGDRVMSVGVI